MTHNNDLVTNQETEYLNSYNAKINSSYYKVHKYESTIESYCEYYDDDYEEYCSYESTKIVPSYKYVKYDSNAVVKREKTNKFVKKRKRG